MALASLTATYQDSDGEEELATAAAVEVAVGEPKSRGTVILSEAPTSAGGSRSCSPLLGKRTKLVSYHDDEEPSFFTVDDLKHNASSGAADEMPTDPLELETGEAAAATAALAEPSDGVRLPPEPAGKCSAELQAKIQDLHERMSNRGLDMNRIIQQRKDFRNPSIYEKLIQFCHINELGTNYPPGTYDPMRWGKESFYEALARDQKTAMERQMLRERRAKVEVVSGTRRTLEEDAGVGVRRRSKWDQTSGGLLLAAALKPAGLVQPSLGQGAVLSAPFGALHKKPRL